MRRNRDAVEGLPMTLMVTMIILAITLPMIFGALRSYDRARVESSLISEIEGFMGVVQQLYVSGPGNSARIEFNAMSGSMTGVEYVILGDEPGGSMASVIRYKLQNAPEKAMAISSPNVPLGSWADSAFSIQSGKYFIRAECTTVPGEVPAVMVLLELAQ
jgi:hypothetical protein